MPQVSNFYDILIAVQSVIQSLALTDWNQKLVPVVVRKTAAYRQVVDAAYPPPVIYVSRAKKPERVEPKVFGDTVWVWYPVVISTIIGGNRDLNAHLDYYFAWRQQLRQAFQSPSVSGVPAVWDTNMLPETLLDEGAIGKNWDVELLTVEFRTSEQRLTV